MAEVKTQPVTAQRLADRHVVRGSDIPGAFAISERDGEFWFNSKCPCGCGSYSELLIGKNSKPAERPSWDWNGNHDKPTLHPSINHIGHWHGWLREGVWISC